jgi:uncharacterized protein YjiS (DUF1127 family)
MTMIANTPRFAPHAPAIRRGFELRLARLGRRIDRWVAAWVVGRARQVALWELARLSDRELKDIGLYRCQLGDAVFRSEATRRRMRPEMF